MIIKEPKNCTKEELADFKRLVLEGGQVEPNGLENRIIQCRYLGFHYEDTELVAISSIKQKKIETVKKTLAKAEIESSNVPIIELGYSYTLKNFRRRGFNKLINDQLLELVKTEKIYATTDNDSMRAYLTSKGFTKLGKSFNGRINETLDYFER